MPISLNKAEFKLCCYSKDQIPEIWDKAKPWIKKALDRGSNYTLYDIHTGLCKGEMQLWMWGFEGALVTAIQVKAGKKFCLLLCLGAERMSDWFQYFHIVEDWARDKGAQEMRIYGRPGWSRPTGYTIDYCKMSKSLCLAAQKT